MAKEESQNVVSLKTADGEIFEVELVIAKEMQIVQSFIDTDTITSAIPLPDIFGRELARIIEYCKQHYLFREASDDANINNAKDFNAEFMKAMTLNELKDLSLAAKYLNVKDLLDLLYQTIADRIKNKSVDFMQKSLGFDNDYTLEEKDKLYEENAWDFEGVNDDED